MFRSLMTLMRGAACEADEALTNAQSLPILRQQLRDCAQTVSAARKALALAVAQHEQEAAQSRGLAERIADLEERAVFAMENGQSALAQEAAETIARLHSDQENSAVVLASLAAELNRLRESVMTSEAHLRALKKGDRVAAVTDKSQCLSAFSPGGASSALHDAEVSLARLRARQAQRAGGITLLYIKG